MYYICSCGVVWCTLYLFVVLLQIYRGRSVHCPARYRTLVSNVLARRRPMTKLSYRNHWPSSAGLSLLSKTNATEWWVVINLWFKLSRVNYVQTAHQSVMGRTMPWWPKALVRVNERCWRFLHSWLVTIIEWVRGRRKRFHILVKLNWDNQFLF